MQLYKAKFPVTFINKWDRFISDLYLLFLFKKRKESLEKKGEKLWKEEEGNSEKKSKKNLKTRGRKESLENRGKKLWKKGRMLWKSKQKSKIIKKGKHFEKRTGILKKARKLSQKRLRKVWKKEENSEIKRMESWKNGEGKSEKQVYWKL